MAKERKVSIQAFVRSDTRRWYEREADRRGMSISEVACEVLEGYIASTNRSNVPSINLPHLVNQSGD